MTKPHSNRIAMDRLMFALIGAIAGAACYVLVEILPEQIENERLLLLVAAAAGGFFAALLAAIGPLPLSRAAIAAAVSALPPALLLYWASFRFQGVEAFLESLHPPVAYFVMVTILLPFLIALQRPGEGWRNYPALFDQSWNIVVRYAAAWVFTGLFWAVIMLSDALFGLVGLTIIQDLLELDPVPYVLTGAVLGVALAVVVELSDYVSPFLILRLLRLLLPVVLVVTAVFLVALPVQGLSNLFGGLSAAATLMAMALGIATLITSALDHSNQRAVESRAMRAITQALALTMPVLAALSIYAIWLRVREYGQSPDRLAALTFALLTLGYGLLYALAVIARKHWMARIRSANIAMALVTVAVAALWLTPLVNPQRISAGNQLARFEAGDVGVDDLDLWFIGRELGVAGEAALARLAAMDHPDAEALGARLVALNEADSEYRFNREGSVLGADAARAILADKLVLRPEGAVLPADTFLNSAAQQLERYAKGCTLTTPAGNPGCVLVLADLVPGRPGPEPLLVFLTSQTNASLEAVRTRPEPAGNAPPIYLRGSKYGSIGPQTIDALIAGDFRLAPAGIMSLNVGEAQIILKP
ncbi:MAG: DUF4153 domain-containing protein [Rhodobacter sp.]|nr:DUF4153 domain-containing protein [Rhodobacter sp.]